MFASAVPSPPSSSPVLARMRRAEEDALRLRMGRPLIWKDAGVHRAGWEDDAELYALSAIASGVSASQRARALFVILGSSWSALTDGARETVSRVARLLLAALSPGEVITVFLALRRARANHKHTSRAIVRYLTEHPDFEGLAYSRRPALRDVIEHAVGRNTARAAAKGKRRLPHARDPERAATLLAILFAGAMPAALLQRPDEEGEQSEEIRDASHARFQRVLDAVRDLPKTVTATNRGDIAATLVHIYRGDANAELQRGLARYVDAAASKLAHFDGSVALILDASASTRGYGEREFCIISQSVALALVLERVCSKLHVFVVGGDDEGEARDVGLGDPKADANRRMAAFVPSPSGASDLASALFDAADTEPDVIAIVTDGYENQDAGDLHDVARALRRIGVHTPIVMCQSKFTFKDDLTLRQPIGAPAEGSHRLSSCDEIGFWHEEDFAEVLLRLATRTHPAMASTFLRRMLDARLAGLSRELEPWISAP